MSGTCIIVTGSNVPPPGPKHSVKLSTPPSSQSKLPNKLAGFAAKYAHIVIPVAAMLSQLISSAGANGSVGINAGSGSGITAPVTGSIVKPGPKHSVILSTPPSSQSNVAMLDVGFAPMYAHKSSPDAAKLSQS